MAFPILKQISMNAPFVFPFVMALFKMDRLIICLMSARSRRTASACLILFATACNSLPTDLRGLLQSHTYFHYLPYPEGLFGSMPRSRERPTTKGVQLEINMR